MSMQVYFYLLLLNQENLDLERNSRSSLAYSHSSDRILKSWKPISPKKWIVTNRPSPGPPFSLWFFNSMIILMHSSQQDTSKKFFFLRAAPAAYGSSQARGQIRGPAASLHHSHSNTGFEPCLRRKLKLLALPESLTHWAEARDRTCVLVDTSRVHCWAMWGISERHPSYPLLIDEETEA